MHAKETTVGQRLAMIGTANDKPGPEIVPKEPGNREFRSATTLSQDPTIRAKFNAMQRNGRTPKTPDYAKKHERNTKSTADPASSVRNHQQREPRKREIRSPIPKIDTLEL
jgi:hypothetical protein